MSEAKSEAQPVRLLIAALGGEGGGVLAGWTSEAASAAGLAVGRTSIPGVAQRTGATTYYLEIMRAPPDAAPILGLHPAPGQVDILIATELLEAARMVQAGFVTPGRTLVIAADRRVYATEEKIAMGDGRVDEDQLRGAVDRFARAVVRADLEAVAAASNSQLNAVLLGVLAGIQALPIAPDVFRTTIQADWKAVDANLRGFDAGLHLAGTQARAPSARAAGTAGAKPPPSLASDLAPFPDEARPVLIEAIARLRDYQSDAYAERYLARLRRFLGRRGGDGAFMADLARHLAVRMTVEDVIRVAQLKLGEARLAQVTREARARAGDIVDITEYMKPGPEEILGLLPPSLGRWALRRVAARGWQDRAWPLKVRTTRVSGFLRLRFLAGLKFWRPRTLRFAEEEAWVERWLGLVERALAVDAAAAREVVATASLVRGYSETYRRGLANWTTIMEGVVEPMLAGRLPRTHFADAVLQARLAASKDPEGMALTQTIAAIGRTAQPGTLAAE